MSEQEKQSLIDEEITKLEIEARALTETQSFKLAFRKYQVTNWLRELKVLRKLLNKDV